MDYTKIYWDQQIQKCSLEFPCFLFSFPSISVHVPLGAMNLIDLTQ